MAAEHKEHIIYEARDDLHTNHHEVRHQHPNMPDPEVSSHIIEEETKYVDGDVQRSAVEQSRVVVRSDEDLLQLRLRRIRRVVYFVIHVIAIFLLIRFFLMLTGANPTNAFAQFIYGVTQVFIWPFNTLFGPYAEPVYGAPVLEVAALVAIGIYYLFTWIGLQIANIAVQRRISRRVERRPLPPHHH
jgi:hypothetical protein